MCGTTGTTKKACTKYVPVLLCTTKLAQSTSHYYFVLQSLHKSRNSISFYYKACTNDFPVLLCTTKLAQNTSEHYFVLQSLHKASPTTAQSASQYHFVLQSLHKARPSTSLYYKACTRHVPVLLCTTKLAQGTSQYFFVLQSLHKARPSTSLYYKACTKHVPLLLCTTKLAQSKSHYYTKCFPAPRPCSHYNAICNHGFQNTLALCTHNEPSIAKHHQGTNHTPKRTDRTCGAHEVPFIAGRSHFTQKNARFRAPASSPPFMNVLVCDVK